MALIPKNGKPSLAATLIPHTEQIPHLTAGEDLAAFDVVEIRTNGLVMKRTTGVPRGVASTDSQLGEGMTIYRNVRAGYGSGMTPGAAVYANATGGLDTVSGAGLVEVGYAVDESRIQFTGF